jgi:hypothetical protein
VGVESVGDAVMVLVGELGEATIKDGHDVMGGEENSGGKLPGEVKEVIREIGVDGVGVDDVGTEVVKDLAKAGVDGGVVEAQISAQQGMVVDFEGVDGGVAGVFEKWRVVAVAGEDGDLVPAREGVGEIADNNCGATCGGGSVFVDGEEDFHDEKRKGSSEKVKVTGREQGLRSEGLVVEI